VINWLNKRLGEIEEITEPSGEVDDGEVVVVELADPTTRKLFTLMTQEAVAMKERVAEINDKRQALDGGRDHSDQENHDPCSCPSCLMGIEAGFLLRRMDWLRRTFWYSVEQSIGSANQAKIAGSGGTFGVRKGWKIVSLPGQSPSPKSVGLTIVEISGPAPRRSWWQRLLGC
jgi:hypothetical protein